MNSLRDAFSKAGVQPSADVMRHDAEQVNAPKKAQLQDHLNETDLDDAKSMREFKQIAKNILATDTSKIETIVQKAHRFKSDRKEENRRFIWFFYELRDQLQKLPPKQHADLLRKAFRKSGATFEMK